MHAHPRSPARASLARVKAELDLTSDQIPSWTRLVDVYDEARDAVQAVSMISGFRFEEHAPTLAQVLEIEAKWLAVRLDAVRRLHEALEQLELELTPRQRLHTDRLLAVHFRELGSAPNRSS